MRLKGCKVKFFGAAKIKGTLNAVSMEYVDTCGIYVIAITTKLRRNCMLAT